MTPVIALVRPESPPPQNAETRFWRDLEELKARYSALWWETGTEPPVVCEAGAAGEAVKRRRQRDNARETERLIDHLAAQAAAYPETEAERLAWRATTQETVRRFGEERFGWPRGYRELLFADDFFAATSEFAQQARAFDPAIELTDIGQALRNVWIMNSIQMLLGLPVGLTPAVFGYSMLYPYTDNYLDDPAVSGAVKKAFCHDLGRRLAGENIAPRDARQRDVFRLVERIEDQFPRGSFPAVFLSLLAIHQGQVKSLAQQGRVQSPYESDLLGISVEKGGSSVLADGYLTAGGLTREEAGFLFGYGVFLQLLDDLQDTAADRQAGHMTIFSLTSGSWPLDRLASRLFWLIRRVLGSSPRFAGTAFAAVKDLIERNCTALLISAVADNQGLFSRPYVRALEAQWPLDFAALRKLKKRGRKRYEQTLKALRRRPASLPGGFPLAL
jgi:hypothetical protein